jgi:hypothetical protein
MMAESDPKDLTAALASRRQAPVLALVLMLAAAVGVLNMPSRPGEGQSASDAASRAGGTNAVLSGPPPRAGVADALEALEPLQRFLNLNKTPSSMEELAAALTGYRVTALIATLSDPKDSRLGYDFDMAIEAIQRAIESEGYTLDRFRFPWLDPDSPPTPPAAPPAPSPAPGPGAKAPPAGPASGPPPSNSPAGAWRGRRHERQPGTILFRIDRQAGAPGQPAAPQELLLLLVVGETPTWGIQQAALATSLNIAWSLDVRRNSDDAEREATIRILGPTFSGTADSLARVLRDWTAESPARRDARFWVCSGAATAVDKPSFESNASPARVTYAATVIPDEILLGELYRFLANPTSTTDPSAKALPDGKIALLVETGSGYGAAVGNSYGTSGTSYQSRRIISIPFPSQIAQVRAAASESVNGTARGRVTIPFDPPSGRQSDRLPALSPRMTIATDNLILANILATIANEDIRYVGIVATDILDVIYLTRLIREHCPDVQVILVGNDLRYTDPQFTLDFRGTIIVSSYPLDARAQVWSYPFEGAIERRLFANEFDVGRYNAGLVLINGVTDPDHDRRLVVDAGKAEDFLVYGKPFVATFFDSINRRPQIWINQAGQFNVWPLRVLPLSRCEMTLRAKAEALIPPIVSLDPHADSGRALRFEYDFPLFWKLVFCAVTFLALMLVGIILYTNLGHAYRSQSRSSMFDPLLRQFEVTSPDRSRKNLFLIVMLVVALAVPYSVLVAPLDVALPPVVSTDGEQDARLVVSWDVYALAALGIATLAGFLLPLGLCLRGVFLKDAPDDPVGKEPVDRWLAAESLLYRCLALTAILAGALCIGARIYTFALLRPELPNDWLALDRSAHLLGGISPIVPVACLGAAILWWTYLELKRIHSSPLLRREADLISLRGIALPADSPWKRVIPRSNARFRLCVDLLEYPITILLSKNLPLAGLVVSAAVGLVVFVWGVVWPRFIPTPEGPRFDLLIVVALMCYLLLLLYSQVRYIWLWRSLIRLFRQLALLPMAGAFDRIPPRVAAKFGRFLKTSLQDDVDLEIPLQQCRLVLDQDPAPGEARLPDQETLRAVVAGHPPHSDLERFEIVSDACVRPVVERAWPRRSLEAAYGGSIAGDAAKPAAPDQAGDTADGLDPATARWLAAAEDLLALRIVYLVSQFAGPLRSMSAQLIYGPILLLLAVAWYPFHPLKLMTLVIWAFIAAGVAATLMVLVQIERNDFVSKVARTAPNTFKLDQTFISNLLPYAVPAAGFLLTAFPSLGYWLGSLLGPIGRAVK